MEKNSILGKIEYMLSLAKNKSYNEKDLMCLKKYSKENSDNMVLGRFMGYSLSDYALATLYWIGTEETKMIFDDLFHKLQSDRQKDVRTLIQKELYLQL